MPLPIAHALVGGSLTGACWPDQSAAGFRRALVVGAVLGVSPDFDYLINFLRVFGGGWHHGFTHSIPFALALGAATAWVLRLRGWKGVLACTLAVLSHTLLDYLFTESRGVALFWPVTNYRFRLDAEILNYYRFAEFRQWGFWIGAVRLSVLELVLFGPLAVGAYV
ncbi:MAG TPA: metal-dependent hydrolase, partial [Armatimonadota bacterium]|nr:metal-dependent hydrolase [Armatimonadota bacterium]